MSSRRTRYALGLACAILAALLVNSESLHLTATVTSHHVKGPASVATIRLTSATRAFSISIPIPMLVPTPTTKPGPTQPHAVTTPGPSNSGFVVPLPPTAPTAPAIQIPTNPSGAGLDTPPTGSPAPTATPNPTAPTLNSPAPSPTASPSPPPPTSTDQAAWNALTSDLTNLAQQSGGQVAITLKELRASGQGWSYQGDVKFTAASTYKLPLLVAEAQRIGDGTLSPSDSVCYQASEWEDGWYQDYTDGACYTRQDLAARVGTQSDNTAAHMLVDNLGGTLNPTATAYGATNSDFDTNNVTTSNDLAAIWTTEYLGNAGGAAAQAWMYPLLTHTAFEDGIPAGVPSNIQVVHKIGEYGTTCNDAALVLNANDPYILVVMTDGTGQNFGPIAAISARVWQYEQPLS